MDWTQTKNVAEANLDTIVGKASNPRVALAALEKKITAEVAKVESHLTALDGRVNALPGLLDDADNTVVKIDAIVAKAKADGRADLVAAATQRRQQSLAARAALDAELGGIDDAMTEADELLTKLQDKLLEVQMRLDRMPDAPPAATVAAAPVAAPTASAAPPAAKPKAAAKPGADALDDEFASLLSELDVDLSKVELPKKKNAPAPLPETDDGIPDLVTVADGELPDGEELPPLEQPKGKPGAKAAPAAKAPPATAKAAPPAKGIPATVKGAALAESPKKKSKAWLWITGGLIVLGGGGAAVAHFVLHLF